MADKMKDMTYEGTWVESDWHITWRATRTENGRSMLWLRYATGLDQVTLFGLAMPIPLTAVNLEDLARFALRPVRDDLCAILVNRIVREAPAIVAKLDRIMEVAQAELIRPPEPALRWKKGDRVTHWNRPATVQKAYKSGKVHIELDSSDHLAAWYVTRIVSAKNLERLEEVKTI